MEKNIAVMRKTIIVLTLLVGILVGALIGNPMKKSEAYFSNVSYYFHPRSGYCFAALSVNSKDSSITYLGKAKSEDDCDSGNAQIVVTN